MKSLIILAVALTATLLMSGCNSGGGSNSNGKVQEQSAGTQFQGTWLNKQIEPYLQSKDVANLCEMKSSHSSDDFVDGWIINDQGAMTNFQLTYTSDTVIANIKADGSTTNVFFIDHASDTTCDGGSCPKLVSLTVASPSTSQLNLIYGYANDDGSVGQGTVEYLKVSDQQVAQIKIDAQKCK